jgi:hypothetical protein
MTVKSMKNYKLGLLTLLISLFILQACNNPDEIGLDVANFGINTAIADNSTVKASTVAEDNVITQNLSQYPIGYLKDPYTGITKAAVAATLNLPSNDLVFGDNIVLDSAVLVLKYGTSFYGDSVNSTYRFTVHKLTEKLNPATTYYNTTPVNFDPSEIGSLVVNKIRLKDSIKVNQIIKGKKDSLTKVPAHLRIPISASFINANFFNAPAGTFLNDKNFTEFFKGIYVKTDPTSGSQAGGIPFFDLSSGASKLELYYRNVNATIDTNYTTFSINSNSSKVAANFTHDYTGTEVATQLANPNTSYTKTFVQALGGVRTKITFPDLANLKALGNIVINKAILEVKVEAGTDVPFAPAPRLMFYQTDIADQRQPVPDLNPFDGRSVGIDGFGGTYNSVTKSYSFVLTAYIQDLLSGKTKQYANYLAVIDKNVNNASAAINPSGTVADKVVLASGTNANYPMKLTVIYTKVNN